MSFPLEIAKLCIDCNMVFAGGRDVCIACGSTQWIWLSRYIKALKDATERVKVGRIGEKNEKNTKDPIIDTTIYDRTLQLS